MATSPGTPGTPGAGSLGGSAPAPRPRHRPGLHERRVHESVECRIVEQCRIVDSESAPVTPSHESRSVFAAGCRRRGRAAPTSAVCRRHGKACRGQSPGNRQGGGDSRRRRRRRGRARGPGRGSGPRARARTGDLRSPRNPHSLRLQSRSW